MEFELDLHLETWTFAVMYQGVEYVVTIHRNLEESDRPVWWIVSSDYLGSDTFRRSSDARFSTPEEALADAKSWIWENLNN